MRNFELLTAACACALCIAVTPCQISLHQTVQAFSDVATVNSVILQKTAHGGAEYLSKIVFLGDSRTYGLKAFAMLEGGEDTTKVWTPKNGTMSIWDMQFQKVVHPTSGVEMTSAEAAAVDKPEILIISLGFNGFEMVGKEYFVSEYVKLIESIKAVSPVTKIILQSMFPVCRSYTYIDNGSIKEGNGWIMEIAESTGCFYLNTAEVLCDSDGYLIEDYSSDGCHLTPLGLDVQIEYICTHMIGDN
ncbi:MAG: hypothetical protein IJ002_06020 [Clostridia bacterium]|nr:hypothetical protein [Clostridia bacterium]